MNFLSKFRSALIALILTVVATPAFAQGCAMCAANAKATPKEGQRALNRAILVMLAPPVAIMLFGFSFALRYGKNRDKDHDQQR